VRKMSGQLYTYDYGYGKSVVCLLRKLKGEQIEYCIPQEDLNLLPLDGCQKLLINERQILGGIVRSTIYDLSEKHYQKVKEMLEKYENRTLIRVVA